MKKLCTTIGILVAFIALSGIASAGDELEFRARLSGDQEVPPVMTNTTGKARVEFNADLTRADFRVEAEDADRVIRAHIHCAPRGQNGPIVVALLEQSGGGGGDPTVMLSEEVRLRATITDDSIIGGVTPSMTCPNDIDNLRDLADAMLDGNTYVNVHTFDNRPGEIRGQLEEK